MIMRFTAVPSGGWFVISISQIQNQFGRGQLGNDAVWSMKLTTSNLSSELCDKNDVV